MSHDLFSVSNQIKSKNNYTTKMAFTCQEVTPDIEDAVYILAERNDICEFLSKNTSCWEYRFFFYVYINYDGFPANEDAHYNIVITKVLDWYMEGPSKQKIKELFNGDDVMRISINRHFSFDSTKHTFSISIISLKNHSGDWGELKQQLSNPNQDNICLVDTKSHIKIRGEYPIDIPDTNSLHKITH